MRMYLVSSFDMISIDYIYRDKLQGFKQISVLTDLDQAFKPGRHKEIIQDNPI